MGISVEQAVDVARESAEIILLRPDLDVLRVGVAVGRRPVANKISMARATPLLPVLPLAAKQREAA